MTTADVPPYYEGTALVTDSATTDSQRREWVRELWQGYLVVLRKTRKTRQSQDAAEPDVAERGWKEQLLDRLMGMPPDAFERLAQRLLREADFDSVNVTGKAATAASMGLMSTGSAWSASRSSSNASDTRAAWVQARSTTSAARW